MPLKQAFPLFLKLPIFPMFNLNYAIFRKTRDKRRYPNKNVLVFNFKIHINRIVIRRITAFFSFSVNSIFFNNDFF